ncbi:MAG: hypothetical protein J5J00_10840 [Deltaproteobacteria bacterium]|nr:hypothetical protein [Deltaproteobacteria bacterium]
MKLKAFLAFTLLLFLSQSAAAQTQKGKLKVKGGTLSAADFSIVAQTKDSKIQSASVASDEKFTLSKVTTNDRLSVLYKSNFYAPVVLGVKKGKTVKLFSAAQKSGFCSSGDARVILAGKKKVKGALNLEVDPEQGVAYLKKLKKSELKNITKGATAEATTSCLPSGLGGAGSQSLSARHEKVGTLEDSDGDGQQQEEDIDDDDDGITDAFDPDNDGDGIIDDADPDNNDKNAAAQLFYFQQLHLDRQDSFHPKLQTVTTEMIDNALKSHGGLALEVKSGTTVELNCGGDETIGAEGLPWCSKGGTGRTREPDNKAFPDEYDADGDGKGEISAGGTGDFQLAPGATSSEIRPGDTFIEEVADADGNVTKYVGVLNSVVLTVPGIVQIVTSVGGGTTNTFDYPASLTSIGTYEDPVIVPAAGDAEVTITLYPPVYNTSAGEVVPGIMTIGLQLPNGPCTYDPGTKMCTGGGSGPGLLPGTLFSNPSTGWTVSNDGVRSNTTDSSVDDSQPMTFTVNLTGSGGVTGWDSGEYLMVPIQAFDNNGTTSAHNVIFKRGSP